MSTQIKRAIVLAAGRGARMRPLTDDKPKPLVEVAGRALIDRAIDHLEAAGIEDIIVNVHYMADMLEDHLRARPGPAIKISDERDALLETGGGVKRALTLLGDDPFFVVNSDALWIDPPQGDSNLQSMMKAYRHEEAGYLMLVTETDRAIGYTGRGDFDMDKKGLLSWRGENKDGPIMFAGVQIMQASLFEASPDGPFSNSWVWNKVLIPHNRFVGHRLVGDWLHASSAEDVATIGKVFENQS